LDSAYEFYSDNDISDYYFYKDELTRGTVDVCVNDTFNVICDDTWNMEDASVVCRQLGFSPYGKCVQVLHNIAQDTENIFVRGNTHQNRVCLTMQPD